LNGLGNQAGSDDDKRDKRDEYLEGDSLGPEKYVFVVQFPINPARVVLES